MKTESVHIGKSKWNKT